EARRRHGQQALDRAERAHRGAQALRPRLRRRPEGLTDRVKAYFDAPAPRVIAHRGLATEAPETTSLAFTHPLRAGARYVETDVHASADGVAIISHDPDLRRLTGRAGRIGDLTAVELAAVDLGGGQVVLSLAEALDGFPDARFNIDIKDP